MDWALRTSRDPLTLAARIAARPGEASDDTRRAAERALEALVLDDEGRDDGYTPTDVADLRLALAALLDEAARRHGGPAAASWSARGLLQQRFVGETMTTAGDRFFELLDARLAAPDPSPRRLGVLRVFALALACGLRGRHAPDAPELAERRHRLARALEAGPLADGPPPLRLPLLAPPPPPSSVPRRIALAACLFAAAALATHRLLDAAALDRLADAITP